MGKSDVHLVTRATLKVYGTGGGGVLQFAVFNNVMKEVNMATWANMSRTVRRDAEKSDRNTVYFKKSVSKEMSSRVVESAAAVRFDCEDEHFCWDIRRQRDE